MISIYLQIGLRVKVLTNGKNALVVGAPEYYTPRAKLVRIKYENSTRYEYMITTQLDVLPLKEQYPAHGGEYQNEELNVGSATS